MRRLIALLFVAPFAITIAVVALVLVIAHFRLGSRSPGFVALANLGMLYWIPVLVLVFFVLPSLYGIWLLMKLRVNAKKCGHTMSSFMSLPIEQRAELVRRLNEQ